jgi:O-antigen/teichoic acid export membrane protein
MPEALDSSLAGGPPTGARRSMPRDVLSMGGAKVFLLVVQVVTTIVLARSLGPSGRGILAVAIGLQMILQQVGTFGLVTANPYFVARDARDTARVAANSVWFAAVLGGLLIAVGVAIKLVLPDVLRGVSWAQTLVMLAAIPAALGCVFLQSVLLGEGRTRPYNGIEVAHAAVLAVVLIVVLALGGGVLAVLVIYTALYYATMLANAIALLRHGPILTRPDTELARRMIGYAFRLYVASLLSFLVIRVDVIMVNGYLGSEQAGYYSLVAGIAEALYVLPAVVGVNLFPRIAAGAGTDLSAMVFRLTAIVYGAMVLLSVATAWLLIPGFFGDAFEPSVALYYWLAPGIFCLGMLSLLSNHFAGVGFPLEAMAVWFVGLAINIALNVILLPRVGAWAAPMASSVAYGLLLALHVRMFAREPGGYRALVPRPGELVRLLHSAVPKRA